MRVIRVKSTPSLSLGGSLFVCSSIPTFIGQHHLGAVNLLHHQVWGGGCSHDYNLTTVNSLVQNIVDHFWSVNFQKIYHLLIWNEQ